jgi:hypothetical protein
MEINDLLDFPNTTNFELKKTLITSAPIEREKIRAITKITTSSDGHYIYRMFKEVKAVLKNVNNQTPQ